MKFPGHDQLGDYCSSGTEFPEDDLAAIDWTGNDLTLMQDDDKINHPVLQLDVADPASNTNMHHGTLVSDGTASFSPAPYGGFPKIGTSAEAIPSGTFPYCPPPDKSGVPAITLTSNTYQPQEDAEMKKLRKREADKRHQAKKKAGIQKMEEDLHTLQKEKIILTHEIDKMAQSLQSAHSMIKGHKAEVRKLKKKIKDLEATVAAQCRSILK